MSLTWGTRIAATKELMNLAINLLQNFVQSLLTTTVLLYKFFLVSAFCIFHSGFYFLDVLSKVK
jgi:hypothetical protein